MDARNHRTLPVPEALLLDRDGTVIEDRHYAAEPDQIVLLPGAASALARFARAGARLFLVSNQSGVGRGFFSEAAARACNERLAELLAAEGVRFTDMLFCPHAPEAGCACRKPGTGMWELLRARRDLDPARSIMIGDKPDDLRFGRAAGLAASVLVLTGKGRETAARLGLPDPVGCRVLDAPGADEPDAVAADLTAVADCLGL